MIKVEPNQCIDSQREDIPWYINGTLSDADAAAVRDHIEGCADCRADVELHSSMRAAVRGSEVTPIMPTTRAADIIGIGRTGLSRRVQSRRVPSQLIAVAAGMAILGVALVASFYAGRDIENANQRFETATSSGLATGIDYVLQIRFDEDVSEQQRGRIVEQLQGVVKWNVNESGDYEIHVQLAEPSLASLEQYAEHVGSFSGVQSAEFTALQLPMR